MSEVIGLFFAGFALNAILARMRVPVGLQLAINLAACIGVAAWSAS